jgi:hypothetical protein
MGSSFRMQRRFGRLVLVFGCLLAGTAGCSTPAPPVTAAFDGSYIGQDSLVGGGGFLCGLPLRDLMITVRNGEFDYPFQVAPPRDAPLPARIAPDGTVAGQMQYGTTGNSPRRDYITAWVILSGRITGTILDATIVDLRCARRLVVRRN